MDDLILVEEGTDPLLLDCTFCSQTLTFPYYTSQVNEETTEEEEQEQEEEGRVNVHKLCGDLPTEIEHELHRGHSLRRSLTRSSQLCSVCNRGPYCTSFECCECNEFAVCIRCALQLFPITYPSHHQHPLIPVHDDSSFQCVACTRVDMGISYKCTTCSFHVHQKCVSSQIVKMPFHRHGLKRISSLPENRYGSPRGIYCQICRQDLKDYAYQCVACRCFFHMYNCRPTKLSSHHDPLIIVEEDVINTDSHSAPEYYCCQGCGLNISVPYYSGTDEYAPTFLHKFCAELPPSVEHHLHPDHALTLSNKPHQIWYNRRRCDACHEPWQGFFYSCSNKACHFVIDMICAMKTLHFRKEFHQHPMFSSNVKASYACRACDMSSEGTSYQCTTCRFWVHQRCGSSPLCRKYDFHPHVLKLSYSLQDSLPEYRKQFLCHVCGHVIEYHNWAYYCAGCKYFIHIHDCSDPIREIDESQSEAALAAAVRLPFYSKSVSLATLFFMDTYQKESQDSNGIQTRKILLLHDPNDTCHKCANFLAAPCNNCSQCKYYLPKSPSELEDPKTLIAGYYSTVKYKDENCNGIGMSISDDITTMKVSGSVLPRYVKHEAHNHVLSTTYVTRRTWCHACESDIIGYGFKCNSCSFVIDTYCALLPGSVRHSYDKEHPFKLTYYSIEGVEEYVCEICEEDITTMWFYHCEKCDHSIHSRCIWKIHIKFGPLVSDIVANNGIELSFVPPSVTPPRNCDLCHRKKTSGCRYALSGENYPAWMHLECTSAANFKRWPTERKELDQCQT